MVEENRRKWVVAAGVPNESTKLEGSAGNNDGVGRIETLDFGVNGYWVHR